MLFQENPTWILEENQERKLSRMRGQTHKQHRITAHDKWQPIVTRVSYPGMSTKATEKKWHVIRTDGVHGMRSQFKDTIEYEMWELVEEYVTPIPCIVLDDVVSFRFDP